MILFHFDAIVQSTTFANGLNNAPIAVHAPYEPGRKGQVSAVDLAWKCGFDAAFDSEFEDVLPTEDMTVEEIRAFNDGAREGYRALEFEIESARAATDHRDDGDRFDATYIAECLRD